MLNSSSSYLYSSLQAKAVIIEKGIPNITTAVCRAPNPPAFKRTPAKTPKRIAHVILDTNGESPSISAPFFEESIEATSAPESEEVTKKVTITNSVTVDKIKEKDIESYKTNKAVVTSLLTAEAISPILLSTWYKAAFTNTPIHIKTIKDGTNRTPTINSFIYLP